MFGNKNGQVFNGWGTALIMTFKKLAKMATILNKTFVLKMVGTIAVAITITDHSKTEPLEI